MGLLSVPNSDTVDVEVAPAEKARHPIKNSWLILY